jgi:hypothetical protein
MASDPDAVYDDEVTDRRGGHPPDRDVGHQSRAVGLRGRAAAAPDDLGPADAASVAEALDFMGFRAGRPDQRHAHRRGVRRLLHERAALGSARGGAVVRGRRVAPA